MSLHLAYNVADKESIDPPFSAHVKMKETLQEIERGQFHLLWIKHKFPIMQKYQCHRGISSKSSVFAEALVIPWDLLIPESDEDTPTVPFSDLLRDSMEYQSEILPPFKKRKIGHASMRNHYNFKYPSEVLCLVTGRRDNSHCIGKLQCHNAGASFGCSEPEMRKILFEFTFEAFSVYEALRIGCYYIISHNKADVLCASGNGSKVLLNSRIHIWSLSFSVAEISPEESYPQHETQSDVNLFLSPDFISLLEDNLKLPNATLKNPIVAYEEETERKNCNEASITSLALPSGTRYVGHRLPEGNLISLCGWVCDVHHLDEKSRVPLRGGAHGGALHSVLFEETCICVHLMVHQKMVKIYGAIHKSAYPAVFGRGVTATFHRILVLSGHDSFMMIPSSFISVLSGSNSYDAPGAIVSHYVPASGGSRSLDPSSDVRKALISETTHCSKSEPLLFRCRVVSVYVLIMENQDDYFFSRKIKSFHVNIPLAGFVIDDGSSSCCCWANGDRAAALLGLLHPKAHLKEVIERHHGRVVVKNHGSTLDPSAQELMITGKDMISSSSSSSSDEELLRMMILNACSSKSWNVVARAMDSEGSEELEKQLREVGMVLVPQMKNVWAFGVDQVEAAAEARNIIKGLLLLPPHQTHP
ncbi:unnamed protein product [Cuscuta campestris]|uniref:CST complex subunit CTC1 n=1 Tax=Cuscuta campestris TaxID=132261 RepID=A0A484KU97_9ASTE|nr:unnamed protein product [Cuscuta campestris]